MRYHRPAIGTGEDSLYPGRRLVVQAVEGIGAGVRVPVGSGDGDTDLEDPTSLGDGWRGCWGFQRTSWMWPE